MGLLAFQRVMSTQRERRRRQIKSRHGSSTSVAKRKKEICQDEEVSLHDKRLRYTGPDLPEEIWHDIHSRMHHMHPLMPMRDAARIACVSRAFLHSWRCHPNLTFSKDALGFSDDTRGIDFIRTIDHILENHSGVNVKTLTLDLSGFSDVNRAYLCRLDHWLKTAIVPGIEEITLVMTNTKGTYKFRCSLLSSDHGIQNSIRYLMLHGYAFHLTDDHEPFSNLTTLHLLRVRISGHKLGLLLSSSTPALKLLNIHGCPDIDRVSIPQHLQQLSVLRVSDCNKLLVIVSRAPNLDEFHLRTDHQVKRILLGPKPLGRLKAVSLGSRKLVFCYASSMLLESVPYLETLTLRLLCKEAAYYLMRENKFLHLKHLNIALPGWGVTRICDYLALLPSIAACPSLETFFLDAIGSNKLTSILKDSSSPWKKMPEMQRYEKLKNVEIKHFSSAKNLVEMTCHIAENSPSLECLTLDTTGGSHPRYGSVKIGWCLFPTEEELLMEARRAMLALTVYIQGKLPCTAKLNVLELSSRCHA